MNFHTVTNISATRWDAFVDAHPDAHTLQAADWATLKSAFGWQAARVGITRTGGADGAGGANGELVAGAQILYRRLPLRFGSIAYIPAGPLFAETDSDQAANGLLWNTIQRAARQQRAVFLKVEPCDWYRPRAGLADQLTQAGLRPSPQTIQPPRTIVLDISGSEVDILARMNQSTRRKVKMQTKQAIDVRVGSAADLASFSAIMGVTGTRNEFGVHAAGYYEKAFALFSAGERCALLMASYQGRDLAGLMVFRSGTNAYYLYGGSTNEERNRMPTYILQWEAIRWAKAHGCTRYDMWGAPDADLDTLEAEFEARGGAGLWGVYGFKRGFGGDVRRSVGAWDQVYNPLAYAAYSWLMQRRRATAD